MCRDCGGVKPVEPCPSQSQLGRLLTEELGATERSALETHVEHCSQCQQTLERLTEDSVVQPGDHPDAQAKPALLQIRDKQAESTPFPPGFDSAATQAEGPNGIAEEVLLASLPPSSEPGSRGRLGDYEILGIVGR